MSSRYLTAGKRAVGGKADGRGNQRALSRTTESGEKFAPPPPVSMDVAYHKTLLRYAYFGARLYTLVIILTATAMVPPFDASHLVSQPQWGISSALLRWDAFHFSQIALKGYTYEHLFAFFPAIPAVMRLFAEAGLRVAQLLSLTTRTVVSESDALLGGATASALLCNWTSDLYE